MATISDMQGQYLSQGLQGRNACDAAIQAARRMAAERNEDVLLDDDDGEWIVHPDGSRDQHRAGVD